MSVIMDGVIELSTVMDNGTKVMLEKLGRGGIIGATKMLNEAPQQVEAMCLSSTIIYTIDRDTFVKIVQRNERLFAHVEKIIANLKEESND